MCVWAIHSDRGCRRGDKVWGKGSMMDTPTLECPSRSNSLLDLEIGERSSLVLDEATKQSWDQQRNGNEALGRPQIQGYY